MTSLNLKTRKLAGRCAFVLFQVLTALLLTEFAVRLLVPVNEDLRQLNHNPKLTGKLSRATTLQGLLERSHRGFRPFQDATGFRTNAHGLRTPEYSADKGSNFRVITLGDSFTFAGETPYRQHWPKLLETRLRRELGWPAEVINLGYPSVGPKFELRMWELEGHRLNADLVIQAFYVGNDFMDGLKMRIEPWSLGQALFDSSTLYRIVRNLYRQKTMDQAIEGRGLRRRPARHDSGGFELEKFVVHQADRPTFRVKRFNGLVAHTMQVTRISNRPRFEAAFVKGASILLETRRAVEASGARYLLVILPSEFQIDREVALGGTHFKGTTLDDYESDWPQQRFARFCEERGVECLDLLPAFRRRGRTEKLYWQRNTHWNIAGNALAADELLKYLARVWAE